MSFRVTPAGEPSSRSHAKGPVMTRTRRIRSGPGCRLKAAVTALAGAAALAACAYPYTPPALPSVTAPAGPLASAPAEVRAPVTILISIDGFRPDYLGRGLTPQLDALAAGGVLGAMRPSFPTLTFPNHEALVTGLRPDRSGIVSNTMYDPARPTEKFTIKDPKSLDPFWWASAEPLWISAEKAGITSATMFWPGSEVAHDGRWATDWARYDANYTGAQRVARVLDWMRRPLAERPRFVTLYFDTVDKIAHKQGPFAPATLDAVRDVDARIGDLVTALRVLGQPANLVMVSDHGMRAIEPAKLTNLDRLLPRDAYRLATYGPFATIDPMPGHEAEVAAALLAPHPHARCWRKGSLPARYHYGTHPRVAAFLCLAAPGGEILVGDPTDKGDHGYDPDDPEMRALFLANGPAFLPGKTLAEFDNVDVYPLLRALIGLTPATDSDGHATVFRKALR